MFLYPECADTDKDKDEDEDEISGPFDRTNQLSKCVCVSGAGGRGGGEGEGFKAIPKDERQTFLDKHACRCVHNSVHVNTQFNTRFSRHACSERKTLGYYETGSQLHGKCRGIQPVSQTTKFAFTFEQVKCRTI